MKTIVITGGAGFIGSHVVRLFVNKYPDYRIINVDKLTYAGNLQTLAPVLFSKNSAQLLKVILALILRPNALSVL